MLGLNSIPAPRERGLIQSWHVFLIIGVTRADLKHYGKMPDAKEELNISVREWRMESIHIIVNLG